MIEVWIILFTYIIYAGEIYFDIYILSSLFKPKIRWGWWFPLFFFCMYIPRILTDFYWGKSTLISFVCLQTGYFICRVLPFYGALWKRIGMTLILFVTETIGEVLAVGICVHYQLDYMNTAFFYGAVMTYMIYNTLMMFGVWIIFIGKKWTKRISLFLLFPFYQIFNLGLYIMLRDAPLWDQVIVGFLMIFFNLCLVNVVLHVFQGMMKRIEAEEHLDMLQRQRQYELQYYHNVEHRIEELRDIRHDYLNQIQTSLLLLEAGECEETLESQQSLMELVKLSKEKLESYHRGVWCKNPVVDALLSLKKIEALRKGIRFEAECELEQELPLDNIELCCVFGNLLDNALEANPEKSVFQGDTNTLSQAGDSDERKDVSERYIRIKAQKLGGQLVIKCENSAVQKPQEEHGRWVSRKKNREEHGRGLYTIEQICKKYNGYLDKKYEKETVVVTVVV